MVRQSAAVLTASLTQLLVKGEGIHADTHRGYLQSAIQNSVVKQQITIQLPVVIVRGTAVMRFAGAQLITNLHNEYSFMFFSDSIFTFLWRQVRIKVLQLLGSDKRNLAAKLGLNAGIFLFQHIQRIADGNHNALYRKFQFLQVSLFRCDNFFPVPLVNINRM